MCLYTCKEVDFIVAISPLCVHTSYGHQLIKEGCAQSLAELVHLASETIRENDESVRIQHHLMQPAQTPDTHDIKTSPL